jgi:hypothetical protein
MKRSAVLMLALAGLPSLPLYTPGQTPSQSQGSAPTTADAIRQLYTMVKNNLLKAADAMPDDGYGFKPTPEQRTFGAWIAHVADAQTAGCSRALGTPKAPSAGSKTTKADLLAALKDSFDTCDAVYAALTDANGNESVQSFRGPTTRLGSLAGNVAHDNECYGAMAVYLRLKGIVPPSSQNMPRR